MTQNCRWVNTYCYYYRYSARNQCIKLGGDLAYIEDYLDWTRYQLVLRDLFDGKTFQKPQGKKYFISVAQRLWLWTAGIHLSVHL